VVTARRLSPTSPRTPSAVVLVDQAKELAQLPQALPHGHGHIDPRPAPLSAHTTPARAGRRSSDHGYEKGTVNASASGMIGNDMYSTLRRRGSDGRGRAVRRPLRTSTARPTGMATPRVMTVPICRIRPDKSPWTAKLLPNNAGPLMAIAKIRHALRQPAGAGTARRSLIRDKPTGPDVPNR
jgi:hypothetical protein